MFDDENAPINPFALNNQNTSNSSGYDNAPINPFGLEGQDSSENLNAPINPFAVEEQAPKANTLASAKAKKLKALNNLKNNASLDNSYTDMGNGWLESNGNKLWNDMSGKEIQSLLDHTIRNYSLSQDAEGNMVDGKGEYYNGYTRRLYDFGTKVRDSEEVKIGLAKGDTPDATSRYIEFPSGELGVDMERLNSDILLPNNVAVMMEAAIHGRRKALASRSVMDRFADPELTAAYGGGVSEYYKNRAGALGESEEVDEGLGSKLFSEYMDRLPDKYRNRGDKDADRAPSVLRELGQTFAALPAGIAKGAIELVDAGLEAATFLPQLAVRMSTGDKNYDIDLFEDGFKESVVEFVDSSVGYDRKLDDKVMDSAYNEIKAAGIDVTSLDSIIEGFSDPKKRAHLGEAALTFLTDPSLTVGMVTEIFGSGLALGAATKIGAKAAPKFFEAFASNSTKLRTGLAAAAKEGNSEKVEQLYKSYTIGKKVGDLVKGSVFTNADMAVRMNNDITAFKENNNGEVPDNAKLLQMAVLNRVVSAAEVMSLKSLLGVKDASAKVVKEAVRQGVVKATGNVVAKTLKGGAQEGVQETVDSIVEQINQKLDSADWEGKTAEEVLSATSTEILTGMIAGASSGVQLAVSSSTLATAGLGAGKGIQALAKLKKPVVSETVTEDKDKFTTEVVDDVIDETVATENVVKSDAKTAELVGAYNSLIDDDELASLMMADNEDAVSTPKLRAKIKDGIEDYASAIVSLEGAESVINSRGDSGNALASDEASLVVLRRAKREMFSNVMESDEPTLGSGYRPEDIVEEFLETVDVVDGELSLTEEERTTLDKFAKDNDIPALRFKSLQDGRVNDKDAGMVQEEIFGDSKRSATNYKRRLQKLIATPNVSKKAVAKVIDDIDYFRNSQESRSDDFDSVLNEMQKDIVNYNKGISAGRDQTRTQKVLSKKIRDKGEKGKIPNQPTEFINVRSDKTTGKLSINPSSIAVSESIKDNVKYLERVKSRYSNQLNDILGDSYVSPTQEGIIVRPNNKLQKVRDSDSKYYEKRKVTKVLIDEASHSKKWKPDGDYYKDNGNRINTGEYNKDDVVLVNSKSNSYGKGNAFTKELNKIFKAKATIVLDRSDSKKVNTKLLSALKNYHMVKVVGDDGIERYFDNEKAKPLLEAQEKSKKAGKEDDKLRSKALRALSILRSHGNDLDKAVADKKITKERKAAIENAIAGALPLFGGDESKFKAHYETKLKNQIADFSKSLIAISKEKGHNSEELMLEISRISKLPKAEAFPEALTAATAALEEAEAVVKDASDSLENWSKAAKVDKEGGELLQDWVKNNVDNPMGVMKTIFDTAAGSKREPSYTYALEGKNDFSLPANSPKEFPDGSLYQVLDLDPSAYSKVDRITPLNSLPVDLLRAEGDENLDFNNMVDGSVELLMKAIREPDLDFKGKDDSILDMSDSPAASILFSKDLIPHENTAVALRIGLNNYIKNSGYLLAKGGKSRADIAEIFGMDESRVSKEAVKMLSDKGMLYKTVADSIGKDIASMLGLSRNSQSESDAHAFAALVADLGQTALLMGVAEGNLSIDNSLTATAFAKTVLGKPVAALGEGNDSKVIFIEAVPGKDEEFQAMTELSKEIDELIPGSNSERKPPSMRALTDDEMEASISKIRNEKLGIGIAADSKEALKELMGTEWTADLESMKDMLEHEELIKTKLGYIEIYVETLDEEFTNADQMRYEPYFNLSRKAKDVQESINRRLDKSFEEMSIMVKDNGNAKNVSLWFDYFFSKNGRFFIDSNTIQPQTEKHLNRFSVQPKSHTFKYTASKSNGERVFSVNSIDLTDKVHYALAQAFGASTDKKDTKKNHNFSGDIIKALNSKQKIAEAKMYFLKSAEKGDPTPEGAKLTVDEYLALKIDLEHLGHALQGFKFLDDSLAGTFTSSITAEFDAVTSGFGLKNLQLPILSEGEKWRRKTGFIQEGDPILDGLDSESMNDVLDSGGLQDSYQTLAGEIRVLSFTEMLAGRGEYDNIDSSGYNEQLWEALKDVLPKANEDGSISSELRNLFKYPFMTFNYAASISNIRSNLLVGDMMDSLVEKMAAVDLLNQDRLDSNDKKLVVLMQTFIGAKGDVNALQESLRNDAIHDVKSKGKGTKSVGIERVFSEMINASYGAQVEAALTKEFGAFVVAQENINDAFKAMFEIFSIEYDAKIVEARAKGAVSVNDEKTIYEALKDKWPAIKGPLSKMENDVVDGGVGVYATDTSSPFGVHSRRKAVRAKLSDGLKKELGQKDIRVSPMLKHLAAAISAGSVVPIHYIDGAVMTRMLLESKKRKVRGVATIHDATMGPLPSWDVTQETYNGAAISVNAEYSFVHEINVQLQKVAAEAYKSNSTEYTTRTVEIEKGKSIPLIEFIAGTSKAFGAFGVQVNADRKKLFDSFDETGVKVMHMAGTAGGVHNSPKGAINFKAVEDVKVPAYNGNVVDIKLARLKAKKAKADKKAKNINCG